MIAEPALCLRDLHFSYRGRAVLRGIGFTLDHGEIVSLLGANGAGKSTLLRLALGLRRPDAGDVLLDGRPIGTLPRRTIARHIAYVPQSHVAPFPFAVEEVVMLGRLAETGLLRRPAAADRAAVAGSLDQLGISHLARRAYTEISGGERQLTLIARALAQGAKLLVMDEPASGLDFGHHVRLLERMKHLAARGYGILMTTHHLDHALTASTRAVLLKDGRVLRDGPPKLSVTAETIALLYDVRLADLAASTCGVGFPAQA